MSKLKKIMENEKDSNIATPIILPRINDRRIAPSGQLCGPNTKNCKNLSKIRSGAELVMGISRIDIYRHCVFIEMKRKGYNIHKYNEKL